jgi:hypothetical protein
MPVNVISAPNKLYSFNYDVEYVIDSIDLSVGLGNGGLKVGDEVLSESKTIGMQHDGNDLRIYETDTEHIQKVLYTIGLADDTTENKENTLTISADGLKIGTDELIAFDTASSDPTSYQLRIHRHSEASGQTEVLFQICAVYSDDDGDDMVLETVYRDFEQVNTSGESYEPMPEANMVYAYDESLKTYKKDPETYGSNYRLVGLDRAGIVRVTFDFIDAKTSTVPNLYMTGPRTNFQHRVYSDAKKGFEFDVHRYILLQYTDGETIDLRDPETMEEFTHQLETLGGTDGVSAINVDYFLLDDDAEIVANGDMPTKTTTGTLIVLSPEGFNAGPQIIGYCHDMDAAKDISNDNDCSSDLRILLNSQKFQAMMSRETVNPTIVRILSDFIVPALNNQTVLVVGKLV